MYSSLKSWGLTQKESNTAIPVFLPLLSHSGATSTSLVSLAIVPGLKYGIGRMLREIFEDHLDHIGPF